MQMFYLTLSIKRIRKFAHRARKKDGLYASNLLFFLEFRILFLIYRSTLLPNIFEILNIIKNGHISIDGKYVVLPNKLVSLYSLIQFRFILKGYVY
jgi:ribosomal protein S4